MLKVAEQDIKKGTHRQVLMMQNSAKFKKSGSKKKAKAKSKRRRQLQLQPLRLSQGWLRGVFALIARNPDTGKGTVASGLPRRARRLEV